MAYIGNGVGRNQIVAGQIAPGAVTYPTLDTSVTAPMTMFRNKIINGNFDIWQRGTSLAAAAANRYLADRWINYSIGTTNAPSAQSFSLGQTDVPGEPKFFHRTVVASSAGASNSCILTQVLEGVRTCAGQTVTLSFYAKADASKPISLEFTQYFGAGGSPSASVNTIGVTTFNLTSNWQKFTATVAVPSIAGKTLGTDGNDSLGLNFWFDAGSDHNSRTNNLGQRSGTFDIAQVQLEAGNYATPFEYRPYHTEFALCQRYFQQGRWRFMTAGSGNYCGGAMRLNVQMRANPTMTYYDDVWTINKYSTSSQGNNQNTVTGGNVVFGSLHTLESDFLFSTAPGNWLAFNWQASAEL